MLSSGRSRARFCLCAIICGISAVDLPAQWQVNPAANNRVGPIYSTSGSVRYAGVNPQIAARTSKPMWSETRYEYARTGSTPTEFRAGRSAVGPMAPGGAIAYINYKPSYLSNSKPGPTAAPMGAAAYTPMGSVRYASTAAPVSSTLSSAKLDALIGAPKPASGSLTHTAIPASATTASTGSVTFSQWNR